MCADSEARGRPEPATAQFDDVSCARKPTWLKHPSARMMKTASPAVRASNAKVSAT